MNNYTSQRFIIRREIQRIDRKRELHFLFIEELYFTLFARSCNPFEVKYSGMLAPRNMVRLIQLIINRARHHRHIHFTWSAIYGSYSGCDARAWSFNSSPAPIKTAERVKKANKPMRLDEVFLLVPLLFHVFPAFAFERINFLAISGKGEWFRLFLFTIILGFLAVAVGVQWTFAFQ